MKAMPAFGLIAALLLMVMAGCLSGPPQPPVNQSPHPPQANTTPPANQTVQPLTKELCESARGRWDECGSACRGAPEGTACIAMCVRYCYCGGIAGFGCPDGYGCGDYLPEGAADAMGICKPENQE